MKSHHEALGLDAEILKLLGKGAILELNPNNAVYVNRDLDLAKVQLVGFDMDYTLAVYKKAPMEQLQYRLTAERLVDVYEYPKEILQLKYRPEAVIRGLVVDKRRGHLFKSNDHNQVKRAIHGHRELSKEEINLAYANTKLRVGVGQFASLDTLFAMPEASLYCNLVDFFESSVRAGKSNAPLVVPAENPNRVCGEIDTWKLFDDVRTAIDSIHADGSLKAIIMADIGAYIEEERELAITLHKIRSTGKKLFLLTNSHFAYTDVVMRYLLDGQLDEYATWRAFFDIVIVGAKKPDFFVGTQGFEEVHVQADGLESLLKASTEAHFDRSKIYQGGNLKDFEHRSGCRGEQVLYVGDHIYGDIVRSKKDSLWRTCLIVEELPLEIEIYRKEKEQINAISQMEEERYRIDTEISHQRVLLAHLDALLHECDSDKIDKNTRSKIVQLMKTVKFAVDQKKRYSRDLDGKIAHKQDALERSFHPIWGRLLGEEGELSRFGRQATSYACIYTGQVKNLLQYSPQHFFHAASDLMSHERILRGLP